MSRGKFCVYSNLESEYENSPASLFEGMWCV